MSKLTTIGAIIIVAIIVAGIALAAANYFIPSNPVDVEVVDEETLSLTSDLSTVVVGDDVVLTATLSDALDGVSVQFQLNSVNIGSAVSTSGGGVAQYTYTTLSVGTHTFTAVADHPDP